MWKVTFDIQLLMDPCMTFCLTRESKGDLGTHFPLSEVQERRVVLFLIGHSYCIKRAASLGLHHTNSRDILCK